jgi:hypothetical protein
MTYLCQSKKRQRPAMQCMQPDKKYFMEWLTLKPYVLQNHFKYARKDSSTTFGTKVQRRTLVCIKIEI